MGWGKSEEEENNEEYARGFQDGKNGNLADDFAHSMGRGFTFPPTERNLELEEIYNKGYKEGSNHRYDPASDSGHSSSNSGSDCTQDCRSDDESTSSTDSDAGSAGNSSSEGAGVGGLIVLLAIIVGVVALLHPNGTKQSPSPQPQLVPQAVNSGGASYFPNPMANINGGTTMAAKNSAQRPPFALTSTSGVNSAPPGRRLASQNSEVTLWAADGGQTAFYGTVYDQNDGSSLEILRFGGWGDYYYPYLRFDLSRGPDAAVTRKATLWLYQVGDLPPNDPFLSIYRVLSSWDPANISIADRPGSVFYERFGKLSSRWNRIDITSLYRAWKSGKLPNYGVCLVPSRNNHTNSAFASSRADDPGIRPKIIVDFQNTFSSDAGPGPVRTVTSKDRSQQDSQSRNFTYPTNFRYPTGFQSGYHPN